MGKTITVNTPITVAEFATIDTAAATIQVITDASAVVITESETKSLIGVSTSRTGEINEVKALIVDKHADAMPKDITVAGFNADLAYLNSLKKSHVSLQAEANKLEVLIVIAESNLITKTNAITKNVRLLGETDKILGDIGKAISNKYHPHSTGHTNASNFKIGPLVVVTQGGVIPGKMFTSKAKAVLSILVVGGNINDTILVNPFSGVKMPKLWTNIVITNLSGTEPGSYDIFIK